MSSSRLIRGVPVLAVSAVVLLAPLSIGAAAPGSASGPVAHPSAGRLAAMPVSQLRALTPAVPRSLARQRVDRDPGYQGQRSCRRGDRPGTRALRDLLRRTYPAGVPIGLSRGCGGGTSEHYDGRALDWMVDAADPRQRAMGDAFVGWATGRRNGVPGANARRLGIMYIIWRGRMWRAYRPGWTDYQGCSRGGGDATRCHRDHVHISLNWRGAYKKTSWYRR